MLGRDVAARSLGIELVDAGPGAAELRMSVQPHMANGHAICHGGFVFTLADTAFAVACNSYDAVTVAAGAAIEFTAPARVGTTLTARCTERTRQGRSGIYDVEVVDDEGVVVAVFRGRSRTLGGSVVSGADGGA